MAYSHATAFLTLGHVYVYRSFRLQSTRPLKELLMTTDGCDRRSAGIGNIAYIKDLQTERIVTTTMRCSKFGYAHHSSSPFGWVRIFHFSKFYIDLFNLFLLPLLAYFDDD